MAGLNYPIQDQDRLLKSKIVFSVFEVDPPGFGKVDELTAEETWKGLTGSDAAARRKAEKRVNQRETLSALKVTPKSGNSVALYLPMAYQVNESLNYENTALNISGAAGLAALNAGSGVVSSVGQGILEGTRSVTDFFEGGTTAVAARIAATRLASTPLGALVPEGVRNAIGLAARVTVNPNIRTTFKGVNIREFTFQFKFLPKSGEESLAVKKIVRLFRENAFPEQIPLSGEIPLGYKYPNIFKIRLLSGKTGEFKNVGTPIKMCHLRNISTVYNATSQTFHPDGSPTEIDLNVSFTEYRTIHRSDILNEDTDKFYEYYGKPTYEYEAS